MTPKRLELSISGLIALIDSGREIVMEEHVRTPIEKGGNIYRLLYSHTPACLRVVVWDITKEVEQVDYKHAIGRKVNGKKIDSVRFYRDGSFAVYDYMGDELSAIDVCLPNGTWVIEVDK